MNIEINKIITMRLRNTLQKKFSHIIYISAYIIIINKLKRIFLSSFFPPTFLFVLLTFLHPYPNI